MTFPTLDFAQVFTAPGLAALFQVLAIDLVLAGDNAVVIGALSAGLPSAERRKVIAVGVAAALVLRIVFALAATVLVTVPGLLLVGGLLLIWVSWRFWQELREGGPSDEAVDDAKRKAPRSFARAALAVAVADVSMSLDNVLGVVGAAREQPAVLVIGLVFSVALMGLAANLIARLIERHRWIGFVGLAVIVFVAIRMTWDGAVELAPKLGLNLGLA